MGSALSSYSKDRELAKLLECPVCYELLLSPKLLACGHTICARCEPKLCSGSIISCPVCRKTSSYGRGGLPVEYRLGALVDFVAKAKECQSPLPQPKRSRPPSADSVPFSCIRCNNEIGASCDPHILCSACFDQTAFVSTPQEHNRIRNELPEGDQEFWAEFARWEQAGLKYDRHCLCCGVFGHGKSACRFVNEDADE